MIERSNELLYFKNILNLQRNVVGVRFIEFKEDYEALDLPEQKGTTCLLGRRGFEGLHIKADAEHITCDYGAGAIGVKKAHPTIAAGQSYAGCGLYNSKSVAHAVVEDMHFLNHQVYGVEIGKLEDIEQPDLVLVVCNTLQAMRIFQGYAYTYGTPKHVTFVGNQAMCGDMLAKPFYNNDINLSLFCEGARKYGGYGEGELGISMPAEMFHTVAYGVYMTVDPVANVAEKKAIEERLREAGFTEQFDPYESYGRRLDEFDDRVRMQE